MSMMFDCPCGLVGAGEAVGLCVGMALSWYNLPSPGHRNVVFPFGDCGGQVMHAGKAAPLGKQLWYRPKLQESTMPRLGGQWFSCSANPIGIGATVGSMLG